MRVLITGSSGRVGAEIARLVAKSHDVAGLDVVAGSQTTNIGSINDAALVSDLASGIDAIIHTAGLHAPHVGVEPDSAFIATNVDGTGCLLDAARRHGVGKFVYTSTTSIYGAAMVARDRAVWVTEELPPIARDIYDETKLAAEAKCRAAASAGMSCVSLRISRCFPEAGDLMAIYRLHRGVDIRDAAAAHVLALTANINGFDVFNISAASTFRESECGELCCDAEKVIARHYPGVVAAFQRRGWMLPRHLDRVYVIEKAQRVLGYCPRHNFESLFEIGELGLDRQSSISHNASIDSRR